MDDNTVPSQPKVNFSALPGDPVVILNRGDCTAAIPNCYIGGVETVPWLVADPTDGNRMFVVYQDASEPGGADIDIYCVTLTRPSAAGDWSAGERVRVNKGSTTTDADQFFPTAAVDSSGSLHVMWYDERSYSSQGQGLPCFGIFPTYKYDVFSARSIDHGVTFAETALSKLVPPSPCDGAQNAPAMDYAIEPDPDYLEPGEYISLATRTDPTTGSVHIYYVYTGTDDCELGDPGTTSDDADPAVIWFSRSIQN